MRSRLRAARGMTLAAALASPGLGLGVADIPSPRPRGWVVDLAGALSPEARRELDALGDSVHARDGAELAVVAVRTISGADPRGFATELFNRWWIGHRERKNGVLVFAALDDRAAEIILGDGIDDPPRVAAAADIMRDAMVPRFRAGQPGDALLAGARECAKRILGPPPAAAPPARDAHQPARIIMDPAGPPAAPRRWRLPEPGWGSGAGFAGALLAGWLGLRRFLRRRPRFCSRCRLRMTRLSEAADDRLLKPGEQKEESIGSVDYDIWSCGQCGDVQKLRFGAWWTRYARCPKCKSVTKSSTQTTIQAATYSHGGTVRVDEKCAHCSYRRSYNTYTPRLQQSSTSSYSSGSSSSSSSGFGGGSSSGSGASGRW